MFTLFYLFADLFGMTIGVTVSPATKSMLRQAQHDTIKVASESVMSIILSII